MSGEVAMMVEGDMAFILDGLNSSEQMEYQYITLAFPINGESKEDEAFENDDNVERFILDDLKSNELREEYQYISLALPINDESQEDETFENANDNDDERIILNDLKSNELRNEFKYISSAFPINDESFGNESFENANDNDGEQVIESIENNTAMENLKCNMCGTRCTTKLKLKSHMRIKHTKKEMIAIIMSRGG